MSQVRYYKRLYYTVFTKQNKQKFVQRVMSSSFFSVKEPSDNEMLCVMRALKKQLERLKIFVLFLHHL